jgi:hypothetical protein
MGLSFLTIVYIVDQNHYMHKKQAPKWVATQKNLDTIQRPRI